MSNDKLKTRLRTIQIPVYVKYWTIISRTSWGQLGLTLRLLVFRMPAL